MLLSVTVHSQDQDWEVYKTLQGTTVWNVPPIKDPAQTLWPVLPAGNPGWLRQELGLQVLAASEAWEVSGDLKLRWNGQELSARGSGLRVQGSLLPSLQLQAGWLNAPSGSGLLLDTWIQSHPREITDVLAWGGGQPQDPQPGAVLTWLNDFLSLEMAILPFKSALPALDTRGVWFFRAGIPQKVTGITDYRLSQIVEEKDEVFPWQWNPSLVLGGRISLKDFEIRASGYRGWDGAPPFNTRVTIPGGSVFNLVLIPERRMIYQGAAEVFWAGESLEAWLQQRLTWGRPLIKTVTETGSPVPFDPFLTEERVHWEGAFGLRAQPMDGVMAGAEVRSGWFGDRSEVKLPAFSTLASGLLEYRPPVSGLAARLTLFTALGEWGGGAVPSLSYSWNEGAEFSVQSPLFWGGEESEWGQYKGRVLSQVLLLWKY